MAQVPLAPPPQTGQPIDGWLYLLWRRLTQSGQILWGTISFSGSNLTDLETRNHADLQNLNTASYTHLTSTQATDLTDGGVTTLHSHAGSGGGGSVPNVISAATSIANETSYLVLDHISIEDDLTIDGYLGVTDLSTGADELYFGTVTSTSVVSANGFAGSVATATTTPAITLSTSITGILKGNGTAISAAVSGTDYSAGTSALSTGIVKSTTTTGTLSIAVAGTDYQTPLPAGVMFPYGGSSAPTGWLLCDGSAVSRTTYAALFTAISTSFGVGDGSTTFNLPNTARKTLVGAGGSGTATLANTVGSTGGAETHTLTTAELAVHSHEVTDSGHVHSYHWMNTETVKPGTGANQTVASDTYPDINTASATTGISINNEGSGSAHNNMQPSLVTNFIIKT